MVTVMEWGALLLGIIGAALVVQAQGHARQAKYHTPDPQAKKLLSRRSWVEGGAGLLLILAGIAVYALQPKGGA